MAAHHLRIVFQIRKLSFAIINSSTILLPAWKRVLKELKLEERQLPRDVRTRWNSTYQMLSMAIKYRAAVDKMTGSRDLGLRKYELSEEEWGIAQQLRDVLKVNLTFWRSLNLLNECSFGMHCVLCVPTLGLQRCHLILFSWLSEPRQSDSRYGQDR